MSIQYECYVSHLHNFADLIRSMYSQERMPCRKGSRQTQPVTNRFVPLTSSSIYIFETTSSLALAEANCFSYQKWFR